MIIVEQMVEKNYRGLSLPGLNGGSAYMEASNGKLLSVRLEGAVQPRIMEQNELEDNVISNGSMESDIIVVDRDEFSQRPP